jgi:hypothetical protein
MLTNPVYIFLWRDLAIFLLFGALLGVLLGLLLIFKPQFLERLNRVANRWISTYQPLAGSQRQHRVLVLSTPSFSRSGYYSGRGLYFHLFRHAVR